MVGFRWPTGAMRSLAGAAAVAVLLAACTDDARRDSAPTTTAATAPQATPIDQRLPVAGDLGTDVEELPFVATRCALAAPPPIERIGARYRSNQAAQVATVELLVYTDAASAEAAAAQIADCATTRVHETTVVASSDSDDLADLTVARLEALDDVTIAVRLACRRFYDYDLDEDLDAYTIAEPELVERCDVPAIRWLDDCYGDRPPRFVPEVGGCGYLGGYLGVYRGAGPDPSVAIDNAFVVNGTTWTILPESD